MRTWGTKSMKSSETSKSTLSSGVVIERGVTTVETSFDAKLEEKIPQLRPASFEEYPGQHQTKENLKVYVEAAKLRKTPLDHVILHGPPGLGKTTLAQIIAKELGVPFLSTSGPAIDKPGDLAGMLASLESGSVFFIDEIHRLSIQVEEILYSAMEDFHIDIMIGQGPTARSMRMPLNPFTLIGATTRLSLLSRPLLGRFGIQERLDYYDEESLIKILKRSATILGISLEPEGANELAKRSRGTPRLANRLLKRTWDFAAVYGKNAITKDIADLALEKQEIDIRGLDKTDRLILKTIWERYDGGPVGIETLAATIGEEKSTIEDVYEPFLVHHGFLSRGPRGRSLTEEGKRHLIL